MGVGLIGIRFDESRGRKVVFIFIPQTRPTTCVRTVRRVLSRCTCLLIPIPLEEPATIMVTTRRMKRTMTPRNSTTHTPHTRLTIRVDIENRNRNCTTTNPVIIYRKDSRRSRLRRTLKKSLTILQKSSTLLPGYNGACIGEQHSPCTWAYWSFGNRSPRSLRAWRYQQGRRLWTQVRTSSSCAGGNVVYADFHGYLF